MALRAAIVPSLIALLTVAPRATSHAQAPKPAPPAPTATVGKVTPAQLKASVDLLGSFDFPVRMEAGRTVRRAEPEVAVPVLLDTVSNAGADWYVRFRALVLLSGFNDPRTAQTMMKMLDDKHDRLRAVAYAWFEHHSDPVAVGRLLAAVDREVTEFVRPALTRALVAHSVKAPTAAASDPTAKIRALTTKLVMSGQDLFRAVVIEALGEYRAAYALQAISDVAKLEGPLQDDAILAIGRIGDKRGLVTLADLQRSANRNLQPSIAGSICLLGSNCDSHSSYLHDTLRFAIANPGHQELVRAAAGALAALAVNGRKDAAAILFERGAPTRDPERAAIALAIGTVALRDTPLLLQVLETQEDLGAAIELLREAFDMLEEDFEEERFFVTVRRAYWAAAAGSPARKIADTLIQRLEF
jgi:HEAT repeat protein